MSKHRTDLTRGVPLPSTWLNALMEFVGTLTSNLKVTLVGTNQVQIVAGTDNDLVAVGISGKWRWITGTLTATGPGGAAGTHDVYVTAFANDLTGVDPIDNTNYAFGLQVRARVAGNPDPPPSGTPSSAVSRRVATAAWDGAKYTDLTRLAGDTTSIMDSSRYASVRATGTISLATGATFLFDAEDDPNGYYNPATGLLTLPSGKWRVSWLVTVQGAMAVGKTLSTSLIATINAIRSRSGSQAAQASTEFVTSSGSAIVNTSGGETFKLIVTHNVGAAQAFRGFDTASYMDVQYVGP